MPDFNKGDFTQQGVNGHVNAAVRLNEKRLVNIDLTSNEEAEGCTITGTVKDLLNDKVYGIGSGVSGNIEITENGENINVAPYATATVNVSGGGDNIILPMTEVTWDGTIPGGQLYTDPDMTGVSANEQLIIRLNVMGEETDEYVLLGAYDPVFGPTAESFKGSTEGDPLVTVLLTHLTDRPNEKWYLQVSVAGEPMAGTYQVGIASDIPHEVA